jgi:ribosomal protein L7/L12
MDDQLDPATLDCINQALFAGRFIDAIKAYRQATRSDLKESKDFIEALEARLRAQMPEQFSAPPRKTIEVSLAGCLVLLVSLAVMGLTFIWMLAR